MGGGGGGWVTKDVNINGGIDINWPINGGDGIIFFKTLQKTVLGYLTALIFQNFPCREY